MKNNLISITLSCCIALLLLVQQGNTQQQKKMIFKAGEVTIVAGIGAVIKGGEEGLVVEMIPPKNSRQKAYKDVDLKNQDKIIMCNGKKVKSIADLNATMELVPIGDEVSFGIKRGKEMMIISFPKADPKESGNMMMMTKTIDSDGEHSETTMMKNGVEMKDIIMLEAGMILKDIDNQASIVAVLPELASIVEGEKPQEGDIIISLNGDKNLSSQELNKKYDAIKIGDKVSLTILRGTKEHKLSFKKPAVDNSGNKVIIKKQG